MRPFSKRRTKTSRTALERPGSRVKRSRLQSQLAPRRIIWRLIWSPYCAFHSHTRSMNLSRPMVRRSRPSSASLRSTTIWVAIPAWSVPGSHRVLSPRMRCQRMGTSISACSSMWPMWSEPVTLGGGMTREKTRGRAFWEAWKTPESIHHCAQCGSNRCGSETFSLCMGILMISGRASRAVGEDTVEAALVGGDAQDQVLFAGADGLEAVQVVVEEEKELFGILVEEDMFVGAQAVSEGGDCGWMRLCPRRCVGRWISWHSRG